MRGKEGSLTAQVWQHELFQKPFDKLAHQWRVFLIG